MNRWYPWRGSGRPTALGRLRVLAVVPSSTEPSWRRSGRHGREPCPLSRAHRKTGNAEAFDRPSSESILVSDQARFGRSNRSR